jgi:hypothetical protein
VTTHEAVTVQVLRSSSSPVAPADLANGIGRESGKIESESALKPATPSMRSTKAMKKTL